MNYGFFWHLNEVCRSIFEKVMRHKIRTLFWRQKSKNNSHAANLSTLFSPYGDFYPTFALCGQIKPPFFEDDSYMHAQACTCALQFLKLPPKNPIRVVFNQACKYAPTVKKICKGEVISPFLGLLFGFNLVAHILFKKEYIEFFFKQF